MKVCVPVPSTIGFRLRAALAVAVTLLLPLGALAPLTAATVIALAGGVHPGILMLLFLVVFVVALPGLDALRELRRRPRRAAAGARADRASGTRLADIIVSEFRALGLPPPASVHVAPEPQTRMLRDARGGTLVLGAPLIFGRRERDVRVAVAHAALEDRSALGRLLRGPMVDVLGRVHFWSDIPIARPWRVAAEAAGRVMAAALRANVLLADADCARRFGREAAVAHARSTVQHDAFAAYWVQAVAPCLDEGFHPPIIDGWRRFVRAPSVAEQINMALTDAIGTVAAAPGDPQPPVGARIAVIEAGPDGDAAPAGAIVTPQMPLSELELAALRASEAGRGRTPVALEWERVGEAVWLPRLRREVAPHREALSGLSLGNLRELARRSVAAGAEPWQPSLDVLGAALAVALADHGWTLRAPPGEGPHAVKEGHELFPFAVPYALAEDDDGEWERLLDDLGLADLALDRSPSDAGTGAAAPWPTLTAPATLALPRSAAHRRNTKLVVTLVTVLGLPMCLGMLWVAVAAPVLAGRVIFGILGPLSLVAYAWWLRTRLRAARSAGTLSITDAGLRIDDAMLLREPIVIDRGDLHAVAIDDGEAATALGPLRFPYGPSPWLHPSGDPALAARGWIWSGAHLDSVPMLGVGDETPNVLLLFSDMQPSPQLRRHRDGLPERGAPLPGLAVAVDDAAAARDAFAGWGVIRPLTGEDAARIASPMPARLRDRSATRRNERRGWLLVAAGLLIPVLALCALASVITMWPHERVRAQLLAAAALTVFFGRLALWVGWI